MANFVKGNVGWTVGRDKLEFYVTSAGHSVLKKQGEPCSLSIRLKAFCAALVATNYLLRLNQQDILVYVLF